MSMSFVGLAILVIVGAIGSLVRGSEGPPAPAKEAATAPTSEGDAEGDKATADSEAVQIVASAGETANPIQSPAPPIDNPLPSSAAEIGQSETAPPSEGPGSDIPPGNLSDVTPANTASLREAVRSALMRGRPARWSSNNGLSGVVTVSKAVNYGSGDCRTYRYTVQFRREKWTAPDATACVDPSKRWQIRGDDQEQLY